jgi:hypothetical protein
MVQLPVHQDFTVNSVAIRLRDPVLFLPLDPGWEKIRIRDEHPESYFRDLGNNFLGKKYLNSLMRIWIRETESF